jgi:hypothetical protein
MAKAVKARHRNREVAKTIGNTESCTERPD